jgi:malonate decarboxylase delta subunit
MPFTGGQWEQVSIKAIWRTQMEKIEYDYPAANRRVSGRSHVGVAGSGDMELLMQPAEKPQAHVLIRTSVDRFFSKYDGAVRIEINDAGATPGTVMLRLEQAVEALGNE